MKFWVGVTDNDWFNFLSNKDLLEVNFWKPSSREPFKSEDLSGMPFLFKLKKPNHHIGGGGFYVGYQVMSLELAWELFGIGNGSSSFQALMQSLNEIRLRNNMDLLTKKSEIGCTILANPFFWSKNKWIADPINFASNIVTGKSYDTNNADGLELWQQVQQRLNLESELILPTIHQNQKILMPKNVEEAVANYEVKIPSEKFGNESLIKLRLGQGSFRAIVSKIYHGRCAMTGENTLEVLEAAHILPYSHEKGSHNLDNGLLLRADFHKLFDKGLVSVTPDYEIKVSPKIHEMYFNGKAYYRLDNQKLAQIPDKPEWQPNKENLDYHYREIFQK